MPVLDGLEFAKRFRVWEEEQQSILQKQGPLLSTITHTHTIYTLTRLPFIWTSTPHSQTDLHFTLKSSHLTISTTIIPSHAGLPRRDRFLILGMSANSDEQTKQEVNTNAKICCSHHREKHLTYLPLFSLQHIFSYTKPSKSICTKQTMMAGMDHFMSKPFNYVDLEAILADYDKEKIIAGVVWVSVHLLEYDRIKGLHVKMIKGCTLLTLLKRYN